MKDFHTEITAKPARRLLKALIKAEAYQLILLNQIAAGWLPEYKFHTTRRWRFDYANPDIRLAVEIEGGVWTRGRHTRGKGYISDLEKYNAATLAGWKVLRYTPSQTAEMMRDIKTLANPKNAKGKKHSEAK